MSSTHKLKGILSLTLIVERWQCKNLSPTLRVNKHIHALRAYLPLILAYLPYKLQIYDL